MGIDEDLERVEGRSRLLRALCLGTSAWKKLDNDSAVLSLPQRKKDSVVFSERRRGILLLLRLSKMVTP